MKPVQTETAALRREQIVEAAVAIIAEQGLHRLSLSEIEQRAGMCRGQLTYYFPTKEAILLAVFDRLLQLMYEQIGKPEGPSGPDCSCQQEPASGWELIQHLFRALLAKPPVGPQFHALQYTFLSQIGYRDDFRRRLATLYDEWRTHMALGLARDHDENRSSRRVSPRAMATLVQALLHGLALQATADPKAFDRDEMLELCLDLLGTYLGATQGNPSPDRRIAKKTSPSGKTEPRRVRAFEPAAKE